MNSDLKAFSEFTYEELKSRNIRAKKSREIIGKTRSLKTEYSSQLKKEKGIKAVTVCFCNIEGRLHMLDFDKDYFLDHSDDLTFDGSSVRGFATLEKSDLRLVIDWSSIRWLPSDIFGPGKVIFFGTIADRDRKPFESDFRGQLINYLEELYRKDKFEVLIAPEIEGMLLEGVRAEQHYNELDGFRLVSEGGYFHSLPQERLRNFIDRSAEAHRAMGFENEKDHPEVAPSQFELNFKYANPVETADQILLYKLVCRQIAHRDQTTASFLPKPIANINGNGMHINLSIKKGSKNLFFDPKGGGQYSNFSMDFISRILNHAPEISLILNSSVNGYRRLDPNFEAPNQIKYSATDRGSMIRLPIANENGKRIEIRSVGPDANPYLLMYILIATGLEGQKLKTPRGKQTRLRFLPGTITDAIRLFKTSKFTEKVMHKDSKNKFAEWKQKTANRSPKSLGTKVKNGEVIYHHEVTNQVLWGRF